MPNHDRFECQTAIDSDAILQEGYLTLYDGTILYNKVWLTTSPLPYGHGLCNGTEKLSESEKS
ncbi:hypothetical protein ACUDAA_25655, partial [Escherichia coli]